MGQIMRARSDARLCLSHTNTQSWSWGPSGLAVELHGGLIGTEL